MQTACETEPESADYAHFFPPGTEMNVRYVALNNNNVISCRDVIAANKNEHFGLAEGSGAGSCALHQSTQ